MEPSAGDKSEADAISTIGTTGTMQNTTERTTYFPFMKLPAELRNLIYRFCLVKKSTIDVDTNFKLPSLLAVSRRIRSEAIEIYHVENLFLFELDNCDSTLLEAYVRGLIIPLDEHIHAQWLSAPEIKHINSESWTNLMRWCRLVWEGVLTWKRLRESDDLYSFRFGEISAVILAAMNVALEGRELPWEAVERQLRGLRPMATHLDDAWKPETEEEAAT